MCSRGGFGMGFLDDLFDDDIIWIVLLLFLVFVLPQRNCQPVLNDKCCPEEHLKLDRDIIYRRTRGKKERRQLIY